MINKIKVTGLILALLGVWLSRFSPWTEPGTEQGFWVRMAGVLLACAGIAVFAAGIQKKFEKKIRICPHCYVKNDAEAELCRKCKRPIEKQTKSVESKTM
jgi:ribosomal protein L40E